MKVTTSNTMARFRSTLGMSRAEAAREIGIPAYTIDNIERVKSPLSKEIAKAIEASTGCSARSLLRDDKPLQTVDGRHFSKATMHEWRTKEVAADTSEAVAAAMALRARLIVSAAAAHSSGLYHRAFVEVRTALEEIRAKLDISASQLRAVARTDAQGEQLELTRAEIDKTLLKSPTYSQQRNLLDPKKKISVWIDRFPTWEPKMEALLCDKVDLLESVSSTMEVWRIQKKDGTWFEVPHSNVRARGNFDTPQPPVVVDE